MSRNTQINRPKIHQSQPEQPRATKFPVDVHLAGADYSFDVWRGQQLPDTLLAFDNETTLIKANEIPQLALASVYGSCGSGYFIHADDLSAFIQHHAGAFYCCHHAVFDFWVTAKHLQADPQALAIWWAIAGESRLCCTMLLDQLIRMARIDAEPISRGLDVVAREYCDIDLDKSDPFRLRYGELIGLSTTDWFHVEPGFFDYAAKDAIATLHLMRAQAAIAHKMMEPYREHLLPNTLHRFGPLTACLQTQGAIALDCVTRTGIYVDLQRGTQLQESINQLVQEQVADLEELGAPEIFKRFKRSGERQLTDSGAPRRNAKVIKHRLEDIARAASEPIRTPRNKDGLVTDSAKYWREHQHIHPFVGAYVKYIEQSKLLQFLRKLDQEQIYPKYRPLVRTGRTSCSDPNLQQLPRDGRFREIIISPPGHWLLQVDYSVLELRTLAQVCLRRYGKSTLADLFRQGADPHQYTAALLLGKSLQEFQSLPTTEQKQHRQRAKAINFGVPGGLGTASLVVYAKQSYCVQLSFSDAQRFRRRLTTQIYPELAKYLKDVPYDHLATNLGCSVAAARATFHSPKQITTAGHIIAGAGEDPDGEPYHPDLIRHVWHLLRELNANPAIEAQFAEEQPSVDLMRRIFFGHALTISGRLRGHVGFSQRANTPFQSLAADGNKLALFRLVQRGYKVCGFVHDEMLILIPAEAGLDAAVADVNQILVDSMREFTPDIPIETSFLVGDRWYKNVDDQPRDSEGRIVPYTTRCEELV